MSSDPYVPPKADLLFDGRREPGTLSKRATRWVAVPLNVLLILIVLLTFYSRNEPLGLAAYLLAGVVCICLMSLAALLAMPSAAWMRRIAIAVNALAAGWLGLVLNALGARNPWFLSTVILFGSTFVMNVVALAVIERHRNK